MSPAESPDALPGRPVSLWLDTTPRTSHKPLSADAQFDVVVLGGGMAGLTTALAIRKAGPTVALVEARRILEGVTGHTTAKLTSLHGLVYRDLNRLHGPAVARLYSDANEESVRHVEREVAERRLDCDFTKASAYTFTEDASLVAAVEEEARALASFGRSVDFTTKTDLPFPVKAAVRLDDQAHFHPRKYLLAEAQSFVAAGGVIFEETTASDVHEGSPCVVTTDRGTLRAGHVVVATHQPFGLQGAFFARMTLRRSYVLAARLRGEVPRGMYIAAESDFRSMRPARGKDGEPLLLVGGEPHRPGQALDTAALVRRLEAWARERFDVERFEYRWATQDNVTRDRLPYVGRVGGGTKHLLVATGFGGWGMSNGIAAGRLLADLVLGRPNRFASLYDPSRTGVAERVAALARDAVVGAKDALGAFDPPRRPAHDLAPGEARLLDFGFDRLAAYRDDAGRTHLVSAVCTHLGCLVEWNGADRSWDCPCHGSRFDPDGRVLHGPATRPLPREGEDEE